jgi:hypothetical protein
MSLIIKDHMNHRYAPERAHRLRLGRSSSKSVNWPDVYKSSSWMGRKVRSGRLWCISPDLASLALINGLHVTGKQGWGVNFLVNVKRLQRGGAWFEQLFLGVGQRKENGWDYTSSNTTIRWCPRSPLWEQLQTRMFSQWRVYSCSSSGPKPFESSSSTPPG